MLVELLIIIFAAFGMYVFFIGIKAIIKALSKIIKRIIAGKPNSAGFSEGVEFNREDKPLSFSMELQKQLNNNQQDNNISIKDTSIEPATVRGKAYTDMNQEEKWRWHYGTQFSNTELQEKRKERYKYTGQLWEESQKKIKVCHDVLWGIWGGVLITNILLNELEHGRGQLIGWASIVLFILYKLYVRSESKMIESKADELWPRDLLWPKKSDT